MKYAQPFHFYSLCYLFYGCGLFYGWAWPCTQIDAYAAAPQSIRTLYNGLDPSSLPQHLAFYELYPGTKEGQQALLEGWSLIAPKEETSLTFLPSHDMAKAMVALINKQPNSPAPDLSTPELQQIEFLGARLPNRKLRGHAAKSEMEVLSLPTEEIDLARALLLSQFGQTLANLRSIRCYEAMIDLIALQIRAKLPLHPTAAQKIDTINHFIFTEMGYRFPPQSLYAKEIDLYSFLPSVLDCRRGVCLGISLLYLSLAQRLDLPLEIITPPGHIYVRYNDGTEIINIETTARGVNLDSDAYLSIDTFALEKRDLKEAIGLAHFNQASLYLQTGEFDKALDSYEKTKTYLPQDRQLIELMGMCTVLVGEIEQGKALLARAVALPCDFGIVSNRVAEDYLSGAIDADGIKALFLPVDEKRSSILLKQKSLQEIMAKFPAFRDGLFALATTWVQLHRLNEALVLLERYHAIDPTNVKVEYYLTQLYLERYNYPKAWKHLKSAEALVRPYNVLSKPLRELRRELALRSPE